jgi:Zn-finger nucleic acid-binding protein
MLTLATVALDDCPQPRAVYVDFRKPDLLVVGSSQSAEYAIEYRTADLQSLAEGNEIVIADELYRVRELPRVPDGGTGFARIALLTKV